VRGDYIVKHALGSGEKRRQKAAGCPAASAPQLLDDHPTERVSGTGVRLLVPHSHKPMEVGYYLHGQH
jgi:hypothetical protein